MPKVPKDDYALMTTNPYRTVLLVITGVLGGLGAVVGIAGLVATSRDSAAGDPTAGAGEFAWAQWLLSGSLIALLLWLTVSGIAWAVVQTRHDVPRK